MNAPCLQGRFVLPILAKAAVQRRRSSAFAVLRRREANSSLDAQSQWRVLPGTMKCEVHGLPWRRIASGSVALSSWRLGWDIKLRTLWTGHAGGHRRARLGMELGAGMGRQRSESGMRCWIRNCDESAHLCGRAVRPAVESILFSGLAGLIDRAGHELGFYGDFLFGQEIDGGIESLKARERNF